jgi:hypothetical protein
LPQPALGELGAGLLAEGSAGAGNWAAVPWISVFDPAITTSATQGYYVVYLFHVSNPVVHLSLNQGTTKVREEFGARAREILQDRADLMRKRVAEYSEALPVSEIDLGSNARLPGDYAAGHALGVTYELSNLPDEPKMLIDGDGDFQSVCGDNAGFCRRDAIKHIKQVTSEHGVSCSGAACIRYRLIGLSSGELVANQIPRAGAIKSRAHHPSDR